MMERRELLKNTAAAVAAVGAAASGAKMPARSDEPAEWAKRGYFLIHTTSDDGKWATTNEGFWDVLAVDRNTGSVLARLAPGDSFARPKDLIVDFVTV